MDALNHVLSWGSPVGIALFFFFTGIGTGVFFWGYSKMGTQAQQHKDS